MTEPETKSRSCLFTAFKWLLLLVLGLAALIIGIPLFLLDGKYEVARETTIKAAPEAVHKQVGDLREWPNWLPFVKQDPSVKTTIETPTGVGAHQHWTSNQGNGKLTFTATDPHKGVEYTMLFDEKWPAQGSITYAAAGEDTRVTWRMTGQNSGVLGKWMAFIMPRMVGPKFEDGLVDLKNKVEGK
ncbi:hypothetical protein AYO44_16805 [Planctomycetaceae bacterium SCGC AG-212-F19]|nr:hypothetical protein AYO44_16805 [Planctomycetaceae bacterium SCGC AG-212-F19]